MISNVSIIVYILLQYVVTITFLSTAYDIYHTPIPKASEGYRDYPTTVTVGDYTHEFGGAFMCEGEDRDLTPYETLHEVTQCFSNVTVVMEHGFTPGCTQHQLADLDWYYDYWYSFFVIGMVFYGVLLILIGAHDSSVICKRKAWQRCFSCTEEDPNDPEVTCHCKRARQWIQFILFWAISIFVVALATGCVIFTEHSAMSSSFISKFEIIRKGKPTVLPCNCGCILQTPTHVGWTFWFSMHLFMWFMLLYLNRIKISYKMGPTMMTVYMPVPLEMGEYGIDEVTFWRRVCVRQRSPVIFETGPKQGQEAYRQIEVNPTNQIDTIQFQCPECCTIQFQRHCLSLEDKTLTVLSYRTFYALLVGVVFVVLFDAWTFFFQIVLRSHPANDVYEWLRVIVHAALAIWSGLSGPYTIAALRMLKSKNRTSLFIIGAILIGEFHIFAYFASVFTTEYFGNVGLTIWCIFWIPLGVFQFISWIICFCCWDAWKDSFCFLPESWTLKLFERDSMGQNLQYFLFCGAPRCCYPKFIINCIDWKLGPVPFRLANADESCELGTQAATPSKGDPAGWDVAGYCQNRI